MLPRGEHDQGHLEEGGSSYGIYTADRARARPPPLLPLSLPPGHIDTEKEREPGLGVADSLALSEDSGHGPAYQDYEDYLSPALTRQKKPRAQCGPVGAAWEVERAHCGLLGAQRALESLLRTL